MNTYFRSTNSAGCRIGKAASRGIVIVTLAALMCAMALFGVVAYSNRSVSSATDVTARTMPLVPKPVVSPSQAGASNIQAEVITIRPTGFHPEKITRPRGQFLLAIENRSVLQAVDLVLEDQARRSLFDTHVSVVKPDAARRLDLLPGSYVLRETNHPDWACTITIEEK